MKVGGKTSEFKLHLKKSASHLPFLLSVNIMIIFLSPVKDKENIDVFI